VIQLGLALHLLAAAPTPTTPATAASTPAATTTTTTATTTPTPARGADAPPLLEAEAALRAGIHGQCIELARDAVKRGQLDPGPLAQAWLVRGRCHILAGEPDKAARAYAVAVRVNPDIFLPTDDDVLARVRPEGRGGTTALRLVARAVVLGGDASADGQVVGVEVSVQDDLGLAASVELVDAERGREVAGAPVIIDGGPRPGLAVVHRFGGFPVVGLKARLLDKAGNRLRVVAVDVDDDARRALAAAGAPVDVAVADREVAPLAYVGAGVVTAGFATAAVTGIAAAVALQGDESRVVDDELPLLLGFGGGVTAFVVGGALIVAERWPTSTTTTTPTTPTTPTPAAPAMPATTEPTTTAPTASVTP
jgi:hypothetical protein